MAYVRPVDEDSLSGGFGCGAGCGCTDCRRAAGVPHFSEYYVPEEEDEPEPETLPNRGMPQPGAAGLNGFGRYGEPTPQLRVRPVAASRPRMPAFEIISGFAPGAAALSPAQMEPVNHAADFIARSWDRGSPISSVRITGYIDRTESQPDLGQQRAQAVRDALINALGAIRAELAGRLHWIIEDRGLSPEAKVEIYLWAGPTPPPVPPLVRIPSPAELARRTGPGMRPRRRVTRSGYPFRPTPRGMEGFGHAPRITRPGPFPHFQNLGQPSPSPAPIPDLILDDFDFDHAELKQKHKDQIDQLEQRIVDSWSPASTRPALGVRAVGHTDEAGTIDYNVDLGRRRAESVMGRLTGLISGGDINIFQRMTWSRTSEGKAHPRSSVPSKNRRVEIFIEWGRVRAQAPKPPPPPPPPHCVAECLAQEKRCLNQTRFSPDCLIGRERCIRGCG